MCLVVLAFKAHKDVPLILAANRESPWLERLSRPLQARFERDIAHRSEGLFETSNHILQEEFGVATRALGYAC